MSRRLIGLRRPRPGHGLGQMEEQALDAASRALVRWLEERAAVWDAYEQWSGAPRGDGPTSYAAYRAALDREEHAAQLYATTQGRRSR